MDEQRPPAQTPGGAPPPPPGTTPAASDTPVAGGNAGPPPTDPPHTASDTWSAGEPATPGNKRRNVGLIVALIAAAIVVVAGAAIATTMYVLRGADETLATKVPASTDVFGTVYLDPSASQKVNLFRLTEKFPALGDEQQLSDQVNTMLDEALAPQDLTSEEVIGWIGSQAGFAGTVDAADGSFHGAVLIDAEDEDAARSALGKLRASDESTTWKQESYGGADLWVGSDGFGSDQPVIAIVDGTVVLGTERGFVESVIDTANGDLEALDGAPRYEDALADLPDGKLGVVYVDVGALVDQAMQQASDVGFPDAAGTAGLSGIDPEAFGGMAMAASAEPNGIAVDISVQIDVAKLPPQIQEQLGTDPGPNELLALVPTDSFAVIGATGIDRGLQQAAEQLGPLAPELDEFGLTGEDGVIANLTGDMALTVGPTESGKVPTGALLIGTEDEAGMQVFLDTIAPFVSQSLSGGAVSGLPGFTTTEDGLLTKPAPAQWLTETYEGVSISYLQDRALAQNGVRPAYAVANGSAVVSSTVEEIKNVIDTANGESIQTDTTFTEAVTAMGDHDESLFYLNIQGVKDAIVSSDPGSIPPEVDQNLEPLKAFVVGSRSTDDAQNAKLLLLIK